MEKIKIDNINYIKSNKYKTNRITLSYIIDDLEDYPYHAILSNILYSGSTNYPSKKKINNFLEDLYDSSLALSFKTHGLKGILELNASYIMDKYTDIDITKNIVNFLEDLLYNPLLENNLFKKDYLEREKRLMIESLATEFDQKSHYTMKQLTRNNSISNDFKRYAFLTKEDIENIDNAKLVEVYKKYINNDNLLIYLMGEFDLENFNSFKKDNFVSFDGYTKELDFVSKQEVMIEEKDINQTVIAINYITNISYLDNRSRDLTVFNQIFGADANSLLFRVLREKHNLCYSVYSMYNNFSGNITVIVGLDSENIDKCLSLIDAVLNDILNDNYSVELYESSILSIKESILDGLDSQSRSLKRIFMDDLFKRDYSVEELIKKYQEIKRENVREISKTLSKDLTYILKGN